VQARQAAGISNLSKEAWQDIADALPEAYTDTSKHYVQNNTDWYVQFRAPNSAAWYDVLDRWEDWDFSPKLHNIGNFVAPSDTAPPPVVAVYDALRSEGANIALDVMRQRVAMLVPAGDAAAAKIAAAPRFVRATPLAGVQGIAPAPPIEPCTSCGSVSRTGGVLFGAAVMAAALGLVVATLRIRAKVAEASRSSA
jgi:hypothetical protein